MRTLFRTSIVALALVLGAAFAAEARDWGARSGRQCDRPSYARDYRGRNWYAPAGPSPWGAPGRRSWSSYDHRPGQGYRHYPPSRSGYSRWQDRWDYRRPNRDGVIILERRAPGYTAYRRYPRGW